MKTIKILAAIFVCILFADCSKNTPTPSSTFTNIDGYYKGAITFTETYYTHSGNNSDIRFDSVNVQKDSVGFYLDNKQYFVNNELKRSKEEITSSDGKGKAITTYNTSINGNVMNYYREYKNYYAGELQLVQLFTGTLTK